MALNKDDLRRVYQHLSRLLPPGPRPLTSADEVLEVGQLVAKVGEEIEAVSAKVERGRKVLEWRIPKEYAPTMNEWGSWRPWRRARARRALEDALRALLVKHPEAHLAPATRQRWVRVTRFTNQPKNVDDAAVDAIGGKMPIDVLVRSGVLAGDSPKFLKREAFVRKTVRGNAHVLCEIFEVSAEEVPCDPPSDVAVHQIENKLGVLNRAIRGID